MYACQFVSVLSEVLHFFQGVEAFYLARHRNLAIESEADAGNNCLSTQVRLYPSLYLPLYWAFTSPLLTTSVAWWLRPQEQKIPGSNPACTGIFPGLSHISDLKTGTPGATLPGTWCYRVSAGTGWPSVSLL